MGYTGTIFARAIFALSLSFGRVYPLEEDKGPATPPWATLVTRPIDVCILLGTLRHIRFTGKISLS